ncbi:MAG: hypothetical protein ABI868_00205 [Acidobacteriota bacterium]
MPSITVVNVTHLHLMLNHVPTIGSIVALGLLLLGLIRHHEPLKHAGLEVLFVVAILTLPVYMSGVAAYQTLLEMPEVSDNAMRVHQDAALAGFTVAEFAGFVAWIALWQFRRRGREARGLVPAVTVLTVVALVLMARAANLGGEIRHPEILSAAAAAAADNPDRFIASKISVIMVNSPWVWPASETVHFLGLSLTFGVLLAVNLRILGVMRQVPFAEVHRLLPWGMLGFGANLITGMLFFVGQPKQYLDSAPFYWKVVFLMIAGGNFLYLTVFSKAWTEARERRWDASLADKSMAVLSLFSWLVVLYAGRMLPFIGHSF